MVGETTHLLTCHHVNNLVVTILAEFELVYFELVENFLPSGAVQVGRWVHGSSITNDQDILIDH